MRKVFWAVSTCVVMSACGGGGGGASTDSVSVVPGTPAPNPTPPTPAPTPTPTATLTTGEIKPTSDAAFISATMDLVTSASIANQTAPQTTAGTTSNRSITIDTPQFFGGYSLQGGYKLSDALNSAIFGLTQLVSDTTSQMITPTVLFKSVTGTIEDYLAVYKYTVITSSGKGQGTFTPKYGGVGGWQHTNVGSSSKQTRLNYFAYGPTTSRDAMPKTGIVKFTLLGSGNFATDDSLWFASIFDTMTVDFGSGTFSGSIGQTGQNFFADRSGGLVSVRVSGIIVDSGASGSVNSDVATMRGQYRLRFVGPNADELILTYIADDTRETMVGAAVGVRNPLL